MRPRKKPEEAPRGVSLDNKHKPTPETTRRVNEVAKKISKGWTRFETIQWIVENFGINEDNAQKYWNAALNKLAQDASDDAYVQEMRKKTISTLDRLIQTEIEQGRFKEANTSMDLLSKLMGYNVNKVEAKVDGEFHFNFGKLPEDAEDK